MDIASQPSACSLGQPARMLSADLYQWAAWRGRMGQWAAHLVGRSRRALELSSVTHGQQITGRHADGLHMVPVRQIQGTDGRSADFDRDFNPLTTHTQARWQSVLRAVQSGAALPPVQLIRVGDIYFVRDGHHRVSVARALDVQEIEAEVTVWRSA